MEPGKVSLTGNAKPRLIPFPSFKLAAMVIERDCQQLEPQALLFDLLPTVTISHSNAGTASFIS